MIDDKNSLEDLVFLLRESADLAIAISGAVDVAKPDMPVISSNPKTLLHSYLMLYGKQDNRHGGFETAHRYKSYRAKAKRLGIPEVNGLIDRMESARVNLENAIRALPPKKVAECGYELWLDDGKLLVYNKDA
jgi:hypothetical protein